MFDIGNHRLGPSYVNTDHLPHAISTAVDLLFCAGQALITWADSARSASLKMAQAHAASTTHCSRDQFLVP